MTLFRQDSESIREPHALSLCEEERVKLVMVVVTGIVDADESEFGPAQEFLAEPSSRLGTPKAAQIDRWRILNINPFISSTDLDLFWFGLKHATHDSKKKTLLLDLPQPSLELASRMTNCVDHRRVCRWWRYASR